MRLRHTPLLFAFTALGVIAVTGAAVAKNDPVAGKAMAQKWCSSCHIVDPAQTSGTAQSDVPSFQSIANRDGMTADTIAGFIAAPHPPMPDLNLARDQISDLVAYIQSLKK